MGNNKVKHQFNNDQTVIHQWIHSDELVYRSGMTNNLIGKGDYLVISKLKDFYGNIKPGYCYDNKLFNKEIQNPEHHAHKHILAIINRKDKRIYINDNDSDYCHKINIAVPDDYKIIRTKYRIYDNQILYNINKFHELVVKAAIDNYSITLNRLMECVVNKSKRTLYISSEMFLQKEINHDELKSKIDNINSYYYLDYNIIKFYIDYYKLSNKRWMNDVIYPNSKFTIKQFYNNTIFTQDELVYLKQRYYYSNYCYGRGISFNDVKSNWNKEVKPIKEGKINSTITYTYKVCKNKIFLSNKIIINYPDLLEECYNYDANTYQLKLKAIRQKEKEYLEQAIKQLSDETILEQIHNWRENYIHAHTTYETDISYKKYNYKYKTWVIEKLTYSISSLNNIYFKLTADNRICTSRHAVIPLSEGVRLYKLFKSVAYSVKLKKYVDFRKDNLKFGVYTLNMISYNEEKDDYKVVVGCHNMWVKDFEEFIHYYKLEKLFGLTV